MVATEGVGSEAEVLAVAWAVARAEAKGLAKVAVVV